VAVVQWLVPGALTHLFVPGMSAAGTRLTVDYLRILAYGYWAIGASYLFLAGFNGARRTGTSLAVSLLQYWGVRLPLAAVGAYWLGYGIHAVFWAVTLSNVAAAVGAGLYYRYTTNDGMLDRAANAASSATGD